VYSISPKGTRKHGIRIYLIRVPSFRIATNNVTLARAPNHQRTEIAKNDELAKDCSQLGEKRDENVRVNESNG
jgi:hypothetical protein